MLSLLAYHHMLSPTLPTLKACALSASVYLDEDLPAELVRRGKLLRVGIDGLGEQQIPEHLLKVRGHVPLLDHAAVVLDGQDHRVPARTRQQDGEPVR